MCLSLGEGCTEAGLYNSNSNRIDEGYIYIELATRIERLWFASLVATELIVKT
jgi:hypothetical protein